MGGDGANQEQAVAADNSDRETTWAQTISIVVPILLAIIVGLFNNNKQFNQIDKRFEQVNQRFDDLRADMNARFATVDARFADMQARFAEMHQGMRAHFAEVHQDLREMRGLLQEALKPGTSS